MLREAVVGLQRSSHGVTVERRPSVRVHTPISRREASGFHVKKLAYGYYNHSTLGRPNERSVTSETEQGDLSKPTPATECVEVQEHK